MYILPWHSTSWSFSSLVQPWFSIQLDRLPTAAAIKRQIRICYCVSSAYQNSTWIISLAFHNVIIRGYVNRELIETFVRTWICIVHYHFLLTMMILSADRLMCWTTSLQYGVPRKRMVGILGLSWMVNHAM